MTWQGAMKTWLRSNVVTDFSRHDAAPLKQRRISRTTSFLRSGTRRYAPQFGRLKSGTTLCACGASGVFTRPDPPAKD